MKKDITYVALDAHKKQHRVAMVLPGERGDGVDGE